MLSVTPALWGILSHGHVAEVVNRNKRHQSRVHVDDS